MPVIIQKFYLSCVGGLEDVVLDEAVRMLPQFGRRPHIERGGPEGRIHIQYERSPRRLLALLCPYGVYALVGEIFGKGTAGIGLEHLNRRLDRFDFVPAMRLARILGEAAGDSAYQLRVDMRGSYGFSDREVREVVDSFLADRYGWRGADRGPMVQLQLRGKRVQIGICLNPGGISGKCIRRSVMHCIGGLMTLEIRDRTLIIGSKIGDLAALAEVGTGSIVGIGPSRASTVGGGLWTVGGRSCLPVRDNSMDWLVDGGVGQCLDSDHLAELGRVVLPGGILVALVRNPRQLLGMVPLAEFPFDILAALPINIGGARQGIFMLEKLVDRAVPEGLMNIEWQDI